MKRLAPGRAVSKRLFDILVTTLTCPVWLPLLALVALAIRLDSPGSVVFRHRRYGLDGREFFMLKLRTMVLDNERILAQHLAADEAARQEWLTTQKLKNDPRITRVGSWLRRFSADELPQMVNVLRGDMSLVGPRPIYAAAEVGRWGDTFKTYTSTRPGLTGLWQISGRNDTTYEERIRLDCSYVDNWSLMWDLKILLATPWAVVTGRGAY